jgi:Putative beta-barrel porin 2
VNHRRAFCRAAGVLVFVLAFAPRPASAQSEEDAASLRLGPVQFRPRLLFRDVGLDDNVFNEHTDPKRDFTLTASPELELSTHPGRLRLAYTSGADFVYFRKYQSERSRNSTVGGRADLDLTWLKPFASFSSARTSARPNSEIDLRARHHPRTYTAGTTVKIASRTSVGILRRHTRETYGEGLEFRGEDLARSLDTAVTAYESSFNMELTPFTTFSIVAAKEEQRFDRAPERDADSMRIAPTLTFSPLGLITGSASFGYRHFNGLDPSLPDYSGFVSTGTVGILFYDQYKLDTTFSRDVRYSYERTLPYYIVSGIRATLSAQTFGPVDLRILGGRESMDYRSFTGVSAPGRDVLVLYGGGLGYRIGTRARVAVDAELSHRSSMRDESREFRNHRIVALLNWGALNR